MLVWPSRALGSSLALPSDLGVRDRSETDFKGELFGAGVALCASTVSASAAGEGPGVSGGAETAHAAAGESEGSETSGAVSARSLRCRSAVLRDAGDAHVGVVAESGNDVAACAADQAGGGAWYFFFVFEFTNSSQVLMDIIHEFMGRLILRMHVHARLMLLPCLLVLLLSASSMLPLLRSFHVRMLQLLLMLHVHAPHLCMVVHLIQRALVVCCLCANPPVTTWRCVARVPRAGRGSKVGFLVRPKTCSLSQRWKAGVKFRQAGGVRGAGCRSTSRWATRHRSLEGQGRCGHTFPPPVGS